MAFEVTQWPKNPDPRLPDFNLFGFDAGMVPPWRFLLETTGATGDVSIYNAGVVIEAKTTAAASTRYEDLGGLPQDQLCELQSDGTQLPVGGPPGITKTLTVILRQDFLEIWKGTIKLLYPTAIRVFGGFNMVLVGANNGTVPNPMTCTPLKWNAS